MNFTWNQIDHRESSKQNIDEQFVSEWIKERSEGRGLAWPCPGYVPIQLDKINLTRFITMQIRTSILYKVILQFSDQNLIDTLYAMKSIKKFLSKCI